MVSCASHEARRVTVFASFQKMRQSQQTTSHFVHDAVHALSSAACRCVPLSSSLRKKGNRSNPSGWGPRFKFVKMHTHVLPATWSEVSFCCGKVVNCLCSVLLGWYAACYCENTGINECKVLKCFVESFVFLMFCSPGVAALGVLFGFRNISCAWCFGSFTVLKVSFLSRVHLRI